MADRQPQQLHKFDFFFLKTLKFLLQVLFLEPYSGSMDASHGIALSMMYVTMVTNLLYAQMQANGSTSPKADLMWPGVLVFLVGIVGNLYHHAMLARIRTGNKKDFPHGGLFEYLVCPQYLFEELVFLGFFMIAQTAMALATFVSVFMYLIARTYNTKMWYTKKNAHFPPQRKLLIPKLF
jgi:very-long-chain enoyl-CoA reductase